MSSRVIDAVKETKAGLPDCLLDKNAKFGSIRFPDSRSAPSKFVRVDDLSEDVKELKDAQIAHAHAGNLLNAPSERSCFCRRLRCRWHVLDG